MCAYMRGMVCSSTIWVVQWAEKTRGRIKEWWNTKGATNAREKEELVVGCAGVVQVELFRIQNITLLTNLQHITWHNLSQRRVERVYLNTCYWWCCWATLLAWLYFSSSSSCGWVLALLVHSISLPTDQKTPKFCQTKAGERWWRRVRGRGRGRSGQ